MTRTLAVAAALLAACKGHRDRATEPPPVLPADAAVADADLAGCRAAAARAAGLPAHQRAQVLLDGCRPCGDWQPLLTWNTPVTSGGPSRAAIEQAMLACRAYCEPNARQRFLGTLDAARGQDTRGPWRYLGELCKGQVSAVPDTRFMGAPFFALDRIARALGDAHAFDEPALAALEVPLPALSISAVGFELPPAAAAVADAPRPALTVDAGQVLLGALPVARLTASGLVVSGDYPGSPVELRALAAALAKLAAPDGSAPSAGSSPSLAGPTVTVVAPGALRAARLAEVAAAANHDLRLAVGVPGPGGWSAPGALPVALGARPSAGALRLVLAASPEAAIAAARAASPADRSRVPPAITVDAAATVEGLAGLLAALAGQGVTAVALTAPAGPGKP